MNRCGSDLVSGGDINLHRAVNPAVPGVDMNPEVAVSIVLPDWFDFPKNKIYAIVNIAGQDFPNNRYDFRFLHADSPDRGIHVNGGALVNANHGRDQQSAL